MSVSITIHNEIMCYFVLESHDFVVYDLFHNPHKSLMVNNVLALKPIFQNSFFFFHNGRKYELLIIV